jgi:hypothetical protein
MAKRIWHPRPCNGPRRPRCWSTRRLTGELLAGEDGHESLPASDDGRVRLCDYRRYKLGNKAIPASQMIDHKQVRGKLWNAVSWRNQWNQFDGAEPPAVLISRQTLCETGCNDRLAEGDVVIVLPDLLSGIAFMKYAKASNQTPAAIYSYCEPAVQWFLSTFASEEALSDAVPSLANLRQSQNLSVEGFANLIQGETSKLCGLIPEREQKRIFRKRLLPLCGGWC